MPLRYTARGFADYAEFVDTYGATVTIRQSSAATADRVWLFIKKDATDGDRNDGAAHMNKQQAIAVVQALTEWIATAEDDDEAEDSA